MMMFLRFANVPVFGSNEWLWGGAVIGCGCGDRLGDEGAGLDMKVRHQDAH